MQLSPKLPWRIAFAVLPAIATCALAFGALSYCDSAGMAAYQRQDFERSAVLLWAPAQLGATDAQGVLGSMYAMGRGVHQDGAKAVYWLERASNNGAVEAQTMLGTLYLTGVSVPRNLDKARYWLLRAANGGDKDAAQLLRNLPQRSGSM